MSKKTKKLIKPRKLKKKITVKTEPKKNPIKPIKILKKPAGSVRFYKQKTKRIEPNRNRKKPSQTGKTEPKPEKTEPNRKNRAKLVLTGFYPKKPNRIENDHPYLIFSSPMSFDGFCRDMVDCIENNWVSCEIIFLPFLMK